MLSLIFRSRRVVCVFFLWRLSLISKVARFSDLSTEWSVLFLLIGNQWTINNAVLNGNVRIVYIKLRSIIVTNNCRNKTLIRNSFITLEPSSLSLVSRWTSLWSVMWIESVTAVVLLLHVASMLCYILVYIRSLYHLTKVWFIFRTSKIIALFHIMISWAKCIHILLFIS